MWLLLSPAASVCLASLACASFVGALYARGKGRAAVMREDRDEPAVIRGRMAATAAACLVAVAALLLLRWTPPEGSELGVSGKPAARTRTRTAPMATAAARTALAPLEFC